MRATFNACQFSFACDGKPDMVDDADAWREALKISKLAVANDSKIYSAVLDNLAAATNYHADYVDPRWSRSLNRFAKIGRHIFYSQEIYSWIYRQSKELYLGH